MFFSRKFRQLQSNPMGAPSIERARKVLRPLGVSRGKKGGEGKKGERDVQYVREE